ncbi:histidine kinase N-terminal 7TM domain-containing protein [Haloterrigena alkaliphila]|uniref:histidine kinase n=1 Tax=Haloterrigena alkaliphila TaxID=2816475 RepID=A0A8A2VBG4_9EURY|nr:histidine kinase N-terminal 7TM domain-containing protein [Haloterrigena alkaliphila]QSW99399.1 ATP-binding protein [Haloterrigena alkaliphila]
MAIGHGVIVGGYGLATLLGVALGVVVWRHRDRRGTIPLAICLFATALYSGSLFVASVADSFAVSRLMIRVLFIGITTSIATLFVFLVEYTGREHLVTRRTIAALAIEPIVVVGLAFTNPRNVFIEAFEPNAAAVTGLEVTWGPAAAVHTLYSYLLLVTASVLVLEFLYRSRSVYRGQAAALLGATIVPALANLAYLTEMFPFDPMPIGYLVSGALLTVAIFRYQLVDVVPIARDRVLDTVSDAVFVVDREDRVIDCNPVGRELLAELDDSPIGTGVDALFADIPELREEYSDLTEAPVEAERELALMGGHFHVQVTPIEDGRDRHVGWLFIVRDITERKRRETKLKRQNKRLERFADLVSHDLRNPLTVADGYVDLARETGDTDHLEEVERAHERMETIIDDVLALAREGEAVTDPEPVDLGSLAEQAWANVDTGDAALSIEGTTTLLGDGTRLLRLLENLFRNSIEHGRPVDDPEGVDEPRGADDSREPPMTVSVGVIGTSPNYGFYVADDGRGLPDDHERVFEEGYTTDAEGTGFGLSIVEEISTAHGWTVDACESEDGGARFEFTGIETVDAAARTESTTATTD